MLYAWLEAQREWLRACSPWLGQAAPGASTDARAADSGFGGGMPAAWRRLARATCPVPEPPPFGIGSVAGADGPAAIVETVDDEVPFCALRKFTRSLASNKPNEPTQPHEPGELDGSDDRERAAVFLCPPLAGHHAVMLRETVETLLRDRDVYVTDWRDARDVPAEAGAFGLDDYVRIVERFIRRAGARRLHVMAVCQATAPALAAASLLAARGEHVRSVTLIGGPIDVRVQPTLVDRFAASHDLGWFERTAIDVVPPPYAGVGRRVYPGFIQHAAIVAAHPHRQFALESRYWSAWAMGDGAAAASCAREMTEYEALLDMTERYFLDSLRTVFQECLLARGAWHVGADRVRPEALRATALCTIEGGLDDITGAGQTHAAQRLCAAVPDDDRLATTWAGCDHYDLFLGPRWRGDIYPALDAFWSARDARHQSTRDTRAKASTRRGTGDRKNLPKRPARRA